MKRLIEDASTSVTVDIFIQDSTSTTGAGKTGLVYNSSGLTWYYYRTDAGAAVQVTLATATLGTWASGGFIEISSTNMPGFYQIGIPNAALATVGGNAAVVMMLKGATGMAPVAVEIQIISVDLYSAIENQVWNAVRSVHAVPTTFGQGVATVQGDVTGKVLGGGASSITGTGARVVDASGNNVAPAATALTNATWTDAKAGYVDVAISGRSTLTAAQAADQVWDEARADHVGAGSFGQGVASVQGNVTGSVASVTGAVGSVTGAVGSVTGAVGSVTGNVGGSVASVTGAVGSVTGAVGSVTGNVGGNVTGSVGSVAAGGITAASIATNAIDADAIAADAVAEIADGVWDEATSGHTTVGTFGQGAQRIRTGTAQAGAAGSITLDSGASAVDDFYKNAIVMITSGTGVSQCRTVSAYTGSTKIATITPNWGTAPDVTSVFVILPVGAIAGASAPTAGEVADAVWDEAASGHTTAGTYGQYGQVVRAATAQAGAASTITLDSGASAVDNFYVNEAIFLVGATGAGQCRKISSYVGSTKVATVDSNWATNPDATSVFIILPGYILTGTGASASEVWSYAARILTAATNLTSNGAAVVLHTDNKVLLGGTTHTGAVIPTTTAVTNAVTVGTINAGVITAAAIATDAIDADALAADAVAEISDGVWDEARSGHVTAGTFGQGVASVQGNVTGSAASVTGAVGSVTGAVGSVTGNVGGNVVGSVASVTGAVGSVTGNVGGNVTGSVGSLAAQAKLDVNAEVDVALDTAIPGTPTANSVNERVKAIDDKLPAGSIGDATAANQTTLLARIPGTVQPQTGDSYARLGAPAGASVSADIVAVKGETAAILDDTGTSGVQVAASERTEIADALLQRDLDQVEVAAPVHSLATAGLKLVSRNKATGTTLEIYRTDGTTVKMTQTLTTDAAVDPIKEISIGT